MNPSSVVEKLAEKLAHNAAARESGIFVDSTDQERKPTRNSTSETSGEFWIQNLIHSADPQSRR